MTKEQIKEEFLAGEADYITTVQRLIEYCHLESAEAEDMVEDWEEVGVKK